MTVGAGGIAARNGKIDAERPVAFFLEVGAAINMIVAGAVIFNEGDVFVDEIRLAYQPVALLCDRTELRGQALRLGDPFVELLGSVAVLLHQTQIILLQFADAQLGFGILHPIDVQLLLQLCDGPVAVGKLLLCGRERIARVHQLDLHLPDLHGAAVQFLLLHTQTVALLLETAEVEVDAIAAGAKQRCAEDGQQHSAHRRAEDLIQLCRTDGCIIRHDVPLLVDAAAHGGIVAVESNGAAAVGGVGSEDHALADVLALEHGTGCQIAHDAQLFANEILRLEPLGNAGQDAALPLAVKDGEVQQLLALLQVLAGAHLGHAQLHLAEGVKVDLFLMGEVHGAFLCGSGSLLLGFLLGLVGSSGSGLALLVLFLQVGDLLGHVNAGEQCLALVHGIGLLCAVGGLGQIQCRSVQTQLLHHLGCGGGQVSVQQDAGIENADLIIAVTESDELNLLCCTLAKRVAKCSAIARVRTPDYSKEIVYLREKLGLAMVINPELEASREASRILCLPTALEVNTFANGQAELIKYKIPEGNPLVGTTIAELSRKTATSLLICVVEREGEIYIPSGDFTMKKNDVISFCTQRNFSRTFFEDISVKTNQVKNTMIIGGGKAAYYLAKRLIGMGINVKIIENDRQRCEDLSVLLPKAIIINGDGTDEELLKEEGIEYAESFVALTGIDEENILLTLHARQVSNAKTITKINRINFKDVISRLDLGSVVYPRYITSEAIIAYVRAKNESGDSNIETLYHLFDHRVEAIEFKVDQESEVTGTPLQDLDLKRHLLVAFINRNGKIIIPSGQDTIERGDTVMVVTTHTGFNDITDILK
mgnify:CR=1 FL=1